jgi:hypothetical protein
MTGTTASARLMNEIVSRYNLSDWGRVFQKPESLRLVTASARAVSFFDYGRLDSSLLDLEVDAGRDYHTIYAMTTLPLSPRARVALVTSRGQLFIVDDDGVVEKEQPVSKQALWHVTHARIEERTYLFAGCADGTVRVLNSLGELLSTIDMPGQPLSLDIKEIHGRVKMAAGMQGRRQVYLWDLADIIRKQDATPQAILCGGTKAAFSTRFVEIGNEPWIVHGSWDNNVYFYRQCFEDSGAVIAPALFLSGVSPIYPIEPVTIDGCPFLLAGTESGDISAWRLSPESLQNGQRPDYTVIRLGSRVKCMTAAQIAGRAMLFAGCNDGRLYILPLGDFAHPQPISIVDIGKGEIRGIGLL